MSGWVSLFSHAWGISKQGMVDCHEAFVAQTKRLSTNNRQLVNCCVLRSFIKSCVTCCLVVATNGSAWCGPRPSGFFGDRRSPSLLASK